MTSSSVWRRPPVWMVALLGAVVALAAVAIFGTTAQAQTTALSISKTVKPKVVTVGQNQVYTIRISNNTGARATNVVMRDPLPKNVRFIRASTSLRRPGSCSLQPLASTGRTVVCNLGNLRAGAQVTIKIYVKTTRVGRYVNRAFVTHNNVGLGAGERRQRNSDTATHRAVKRDAGKLRCGVKAVGANPGAIACVGGVKAIARR